MTPEEKTLMLMERKRLRDEAKEAKRMAREERARLKQDESRARLAHEMDRRAAALVAAGDDEMAAARLLAEPVSQLRAYLPRDAEPTVPDFVEAAIRLMFANMPSSFGPREWGSVLGVLLDKFLLLSGKPNQRVESVLQGILPPDMSREEYNGVIRYAERIIEEAKADGSYLDLEGGAASSQAETGSGIQGSQSGDPVGGRAGGDAGRTSGDGQDDGVPLPPPPPGPEVAA